MNQRELYEQQLGGECGPQLRVALGKRETALLQWILQTIGGDADRTDYRFAELSIGDGQLSRGLARSRPAARIDCIDISASRLEHSRYAAFAESEEIAVRMRFLELNLDSEFSRLERGVYDAVVGIDVLEHVFDVFGFIRHCREVLKPEGWLFLRVPNIAYLKHRWEVLRGRVPVTSSWFETPGSFRSWKVQHGWDGGHLHFFTIGALEWLLRDEGFQCLVWRDVGARAEALRRIWPGMLFGNVAVCARKVERLPDASAR